MQAESAKIRVDWRIAVAAAAILTMLFAVLALPIARPTPAGVQFAPQVRSQVFMWGLWLLLLPLVFAISQRAHAMGLFTPKSIVLHIAAALVMAAIHGMLWGVIRWYTNPGNARNVEGMVRTMVAFVYGGNLLRYFVIAVAYHGLAFRREAEERRVAEAKLEARLAEAKLEALEARLHPHFLFNALNTVGALITTNPPAAQSVVENLGELLRATLNAEPGKEVHLRTELQLLDQYIAIQQARFSDRLQVHVNAADDLMTARVPQLVLQPFVENAVRHGISPREAPGTVDINVTRANGRLRLSVRDDGVGFRASTQRDNGKGLGISNTRARLEQLYGTDFVLDLAPNEPTGVVVTIEFPYRT